MEPAEGAEIRMFAYTKKRDKEHCHPKDEFYIGKAYHNPFILQLLPGIGIVVECFLERNGYINDNLFVEHGYLKMMIALFIIVFIYNCYEKSVWYYYGVSEKGLNEYYFFKYVRTIPWSRIAQVGVQQDSTRNLGLIVTLDSAPLWDTNRRKGSKAYWRQYRPHVLYIWYFRKARPVFEKRYGKLDY